MEFGSWPYPILRIDCPQCQLSGGRLLRTCRFAHLAPFPDM
jgi:hypothetical protein